MGIFVLLRTTDAAFDSRPVTRKDRKEFCHPDGIGAGAGTEDTEPDWTRAGIGRVRRTGRVIGEVAGEEGG